MLAVMAKGFVGLALCAGCAILPAKAAQPSEAAALASLEPGEWELSERGANEPPRRLCVSDRSVLLHPQHSGRKCRHYVVRTSEREIAVSFDCGSGVQGRTDLRIETPRLVQIASQGVSDGRPYSVALEGRRVGVCRAGAAAR